MKAAIVLEEISVDDPMMTTAQLVHERAKAGNRLVGRVNVTSNAMTRIGALCYVRRRLGHHEKAAERFKSLYESLYGSGMPAVDAGRIQVDTSIQAHDNGIAGRLDRGVDLDSARRALGPKAFDLLVAIVVLGAPCDHMADVLPSGEPNRRHVARCVDDLLSHLDRLADWWGYKTVNA